MLYLGRNGFFEGKGVSAVEGGTSKAIKTRVTENDETL